MRESAKKALKRFLDEDMGKGDITSKLLQGKKISASIIARERGIVAGVRYSKEIFTSGGCKVRVLKKDGQRVAPNETVMTIQGQTYAILSRERTALNLLSRMSGIATKTSTLAEIIRKTNRKVRLYATRKTAPGLRLFDKEAVEIGGGYKHRLYLDQMILIKDNHIASSKSLPYLIQTARKRYKKIEVEVGSLSDAITAAKLGTTIIMLDNIPPMKISKIIKSLQDIGLRKKVKIEASGGINSSNIASYAKAGVDMISVGELTNSVTGLDLSLEVNR